MRMQAEVVTTKVSAADSQGSLLRFLRGLQPECSNQLAFGIAETTVLSKLLTASSVIAFICEEAVRIAE